MEASSAHALLLIELQAALTAMGATSPNYASVTAALRCAEESKAVARTPHDHELRTELLRRSAYHLRLAYTRTACVAENDALEMARRLMTATFMEYASAQRESHTVAGGSPYWLDEATA